MPVIDAIQKYRVYSASLTSHDLEKIATVSETCKTFLKERAIRWLHNHRSSTILYQYSSDTTPIVTKETFKRQWENLSVVRRGRSSKDLLVQRAFLTEASGPPIAIFMEPQEVKDKTAFTHYNAARQFMAFPREYGHQGGCVKHFVMDRAILSSTTRLLAKTQVLLNEADDDVLDKGCAHRLYLTQLNTQVGCACHDAQGGLKWGVLAFINDKETLRSCYISVESLRNGFDILVRHAPSWISQRLVYEDWCIEGVRAVYTALGTMALATNS
jgi:hypothetical protein